MKQLNRKIGPHLWKVLWSLANDEREKYYLFEQFAYKYYPDKQLAKQEIEKAGQFADIYVIEIEHISGKEIQEK